MKREKQKIIFYLVLGVVFLVGVILRLKTYFLVRPLWHDECSLAMNILSKNLLGYFGLLEHAQSAPPIFMGLTKIIAVILGYKEWVLRLIPLLAGLSSIAIFYLLSKQIFKNRLVLVVANLLFAINYHLIYYTQEFKQYSTDVFTILCLLLCLSNIDLKELSNIKTFILGIILSLCPLFSLPSVFVIGAFMLLQLTKERFKNLKKILLISLLILIVMFFYYIKVLYPSMASMLSTLGSNYWESGFLKLSSESILYLLKINLDYFFAPNNMTLITVMLIVAGLIKMCQTKNKGQIYNTNYLMLYTLILAIMASALSLYPIYQRVALYLVPISIIFFCYFFEDFRLGCKKHIVRNITFLLVLLISFRAYNLTYFMKFFDKNIFVRKDARNAMEFVKEQYKASDYFLYNNASDSEFYYYSSYFDFVPEKTGLINLPEYNKSLYMNILNLLPTDKNYWFYYAYDYSKEPVIEFLKEWSKSKNVIVQKDFNSSFVMYIQNR